ncbi:MAG TPA: DUF1223 domain-containing protein [Devosia sp.]|nr:DUF1223 domain-containing protein [Devosia sp.]
MSLRAVLTAALTVLGLLSTVAGAGELKQSPRAVVELFTSQGCSSCPKADAMLKDMAAKPDIIALAYHVDYWDYVGWSDTFGSKAHSDHQRDYAESWGSSRIFTPQMVVNGKKGVVASRSRDVGSAIDAATLQLPVALKSAGDTLEIDIPADPRFTDGVVWLVTFIDHADVKIGRGENEGKTIGYSQIVTGRQVLGMWEPGAGAHLKLPLGEVLTPPANGAVIMVQQENAGLPSTILGAASFTQ